LEECARVCFILSHYIPPGGIAQARHYGFLTSVEKLDF
jgi:hypothetical protein